MGKTVPEEVGASGRGPGKAWREGMGAVTIVTVQWSSEERFKPLTALFHLQT